MCFTEPRLIPGFSRILDYKNMARREFVCRSMNKRGYADDTVFFMHVEMLPKKRHRATAHRPVTLFLLYVNDF